MDCEEMSCYCHFKCMEKNGLAVCYIWWLNDLYGMSFVKWYCWCWTCARVISCFPLKHNRLHCFALLFILPCVNLGVKCLSLTFVLGFQWRRSHCFSVATFMKLLIYCKRRLYFTRKNKNKKNPHSQALVNTSRHHARVCSSWFLCLTHRP